MHNVTQLYFALRASASTGTVTNDTTYLYLPLNYMHKGVLLVIDRTVEVGTCTLDGKLEFYAPAAGDWIEVEGAAFPQFADGVTANRYLLVYPGITAADADDNIALDTAEGTKCGAFLPYQTRLAVTTGGTSVSNTYSAEGWLLP